jgi:DNA-binding beta-propeller fold protein YncE
MRMRRAAAALLLVASACATLKRAAPVVQPLGDEGEVHVYLLRLPREAERLSFTLESVSLRLADGTVVPLRLEDRDIVGTEASEQRPIATGRVRPGRYAGLEVKVLSATVATEKERSRLLVAPEPSRVDLELDVRSGRALVVWLTLQPESARAEFTFAPVFGAMIPPQTPPQVSLYATNQGAANLTVADHGQKLVTGVIPVGGTPRGIALDAFASRAWVALFREDQLEILDVAASASLGRIRLSPGDGPSDVRLAFDRTLVVVNERSRSVAFVDPLSAAEIGRVQVGDDPTALVLDHSLRRAFVANRGSGSVTEIDIANRAVVGTVGTDPEPLDLEVSRDDTRLYVIHRGSSYLAVFAVPTLAPVARTYVGLGATTMKIDPRTDLIYLSRGGERRITVHDPISLQAVDQIDVPGAVSHMTIDDVENTLLCLVPERRSLLVLDLTSRRLVAELPVGADPYTLAVGSGERF